MAKILGREVNTDKYLDRLFSFLGYIVVALVVMVLAALLIVVLPIASIADEQSQLWDAREEIKRRNLKQTFSFLGNVAIALAGIGGLLLLLTLIPFFYLADALSKLWKLWKARERP